MAYEMDMGQEKEPVRNDKFEDGRHEFIVLGMEARVSKSGNDMFVTTLKKDSKKIDVYLVATPGKRWMLKSLLDCVGIKKNEQGKYLWDVTDVINKRVIGIIENIEEEFINRNGENQKTTKSKIVGFEPTEIAWDE